MMGVWGGYAVVAWARFGEMSERWACRVLGVDRTSVRYKATRAPDAELRDRLRALAQERRRFSYRRLHVLLRREGHAVNRKRVQRLYVRRRGGRKRAMGTRRPIEVSLQTNQRWSLDFVSDQMTDGRRFRILTVGGAALREGSAPAALATHHQHGSDHARTLVTAG
jgi:putative transposase